MNKKISFAFFCCVLGFYSQELFAVPSNIKPFEILDSKPDARATALGNTYTGISDNFGAEFFNPAGLADIVNIEIPLALNNYFDNITQYYTGFAWNMHDLNVSNVDEMGTIAADFVRFENNATKLKCDLIGVSYAKTIFKYNQTGRIAIGATYKFYKDDLSSTPETKEGSAFDAGAMWKIPYYNIKIGASVLNIGEKAKYPAGDIEPPTQARLGISGGFFLNRILLGLDTVKLIHDGNLNFDSGIEYWFLKTMALRVGYDSLKQYGTGLSSGLGIMLEDLDLFFWYAREIKIDYSFIPNGGSYNTHHISILFKFGPE
jgi:hypothetical protein